MIIIPITTSFLSRNLIVIKLTLQNPEWGFRVISKLDGSPWFSYWSNKLNIGVLFNGKYISNTYGQHSGYLGLNENKLLIDVNGYSPINQTNYITLKPGTQATGIIISIANNLQANNLVLAPYNSLVNKAVLQFSSINSFNITNYYTKIEFSVSTSILTPNSFNYIEWNIIENSLNGTNRYAMQYKTLVIVYNFSAYEFAIRSSSASITFIPASSKSLPIEIFCEYPPNNNLTILVDISLDYYYLYADPETLTFSPGEQFKYFTIVNWFFDSSFLVETQNFTLGLSGIDSRAYISNKAYSVQILATTNSAPVVFQLSFTDITTNSLNVRIAVNMQVLVYWEFCEYSSDFSSLEWLKNNVYTLIPNVTAKNIDINTQIANYIELISSIINGNDSWDSSQNKAYTESIGTCFYSMAMLSSGIQTILFSPNFLWAQTAYKFQIFAENSDGNYSSTFYTGNTLEMNSPMVITISLPSDTTLNYTNLTPILSESLGISSKILQPYASFRRILNTNIVWLLNIDRSLPFSPNLIYHNIDMNILSEGIDPDFNISAQVLDRNHFAVPQGTFTLKLTSIAFFTIEANLSSSGMAYCIAEASANQSITLTNTQIFFGLNRLNQITSNNNTEVFASTNLTLSGLKDNTPYTVSCISASNYPAWPDLSTISVLLGYTAINTSANYANSCMLYYSMISILALIL